MKYTVTPPYYNEVEELDEEEFLPWYRSRVRLMAVGVAGAVVILLVLMIVWMNPWNGKFQNASANSALKDTATTVAGTDGAAAGSANASSDGKGSANVSGSGSVSYVAVPGSSSSTSSSSNGGNGSNGKDGKDGKNGTDTTVYVGQPTPTTTVVTVPGTPTTVKTPSTTPITIKVTTPTTAPVPGLQVNVPGLLNVYAGLDLGETLASVDNSLLPYGNLTSNINVGGVTTQIFDTSKTTGSPSSVTVTALNNVVTGAVKVGF